MIASLALAILLQGGAQTPSSARVQSGVDVTPDTVTVGDPFVLTVRVRAPRGATIAFPDPPAAEPLVPVEPVDPVQIVSAADTTAVEQTARYRLVAWETGPVQLGLRDVVVRIGAREVRVSLRNARVFVRSVLPADSAQRVPKPPRDLMTAARPLWMYWLMIAVATLILALFAWWYWRRRRRLAMHVPDALEMAEREFDRVEALRLVDAGERGRHVALMVEVLRAYLSARFAAATRSLTSWELLQVAASVPTIPTARLEALLAEADLIKFARRPVTMDRARELGRGARAMVRAIDAAEQAAAAAAAEAAARKEAA